MKGYVKPEIHEISDMMETVGLLSGETTEDEVTLRWSNHDHGHYSDLWIGIRRPNLNKMHAELKLFLLDSARKIVSLRDKPSNCTSYSYTESSITLQFDFVANNEDKRQCSVSGLKFSPGPIDPSSPYMRDCIDSGSYGKPESLDNGARLRPGIPDVPRQDSQEFNGQGNAQVGVAAAFSFLITWN